jgi:hypothetical protein
LFICARKSLLRFRKDCEARASSPVRECYRIVTAAARLEHRYQRILRAILPAAAATGRCIHRAP